MSMTDIQFLGLQKEEIETTALAYEGYALGLFDRDDEPAPMIYRASSALISASFFLLFDLSRAKENFYRAALNFRELNNPTWKLWAICSDNLNGILNDHSTKTIDDENNEMERFCNMLSAYYLELSRVEKQSLENGFWYEHSFGSFVHKIPTLDIPMRLVSDMIKQSLKWHKRVGSDSLAMLSNFLQRNLELLHLKQSDGYHWKNMLGSSVPVEPLTIAVLIPIIKRWKLSSDLPALIEQLDTRGFQTVLLELAESLDSEKGPGPIRAT